MKKYAFLIMVSFFLTNVAFCQFDEIKTFLTIGQPNKAKEALDALAKKPKNLANPQFYIAKAAVLSASLDKASKPELHALRDSVAAAYKKYLSLDATKSQVNDPAYAPAPVNIYISYYRESIEFFNASLWSDAGPSFAKTIEWSDYLIDNKLVNMTFDTTSNLLAGYSFQNDKKDEEAYKFYKKLSDKKIGGSNNDIVYKFIMNYAFDRDDMVGFENARKTGGELYPKMEYFTYTDMDFILEVKDEARKIRKIEEKIAKEPSNQEIAKTYGLILYSKLNIEKAEETIPEYAADEAKMITALTKVSDAKPDDGTTLFALGAHYFNKSMRIKAKIDDVNDSVRIFNNNAKADKTGKKPAPPKAWTDKRDQLRKMQDGTFDQALPYLLKSTIALEKNAANSRQDLQNYKSAVDQLIEIFSTKRQFSKVPADKLKFEAEEKKWNDTYDKIKDISVK